MFARKKEAPATALILALVVPMLDCTIKDAKKKSFLSIIEDDETITLQLSFVFPEKIQISFINTINNQLQTQKCLKKAIISHKILTRVPQSSLQPLPTIHNIIAITAGKGGVGKSTVSLNIALALKQLGARVGLLDADIYGPNQPQLLGIDLHQTQLQTTDNQFIPHQAFDMPTMSIGYLIDPDAPAIWRGPMVTKALMQMLSQTQWGELDYLIIDMPPGTGDIPLTLAQKIPVTGSVVVATPQALALGDIEKSMAMLKKVDISILGIVENMSMFHCTACGAEQTIFAQKNGEALSQQFNTDLLASIPLDPSIDQAAQKGTPVALEKNTAASLLFECLAAKISIAIAGLKRDYSVQFPKVVVEAQQPKS